MQVTYLVSSQIFDRIILSQPGPPQSPLPRHVKFLDQMSLQRRYIRLRLIAFVAAQTDIEQALSVAKFLNPRQLRTLEGGGR